MTIAPARQSRPVRQPIPALLALLLLAAPPAAAVAQEATPDLLKREAIVETGAPLPTGRTPAPAVSPAAAGATYTVRPGETLYGILEKLGVPRSRRNAYIRELKALNPRITDIDHLPFGKVLRLPDPEAGHDSAAVPDPAAAPAPVPEASRASSAPFTVPEPKLLPPPASRVPLEALPLLVEAFTGLGEKVHTSGDLYLPMASTGSMKLDGSRFPSIDLANGTTIIFDTVDMFSPEYEKQVEANWPGYRFIDLRPGDAPESILGRALEASGYLSVERRRKVILGTETRVALTPDWLVHKEAGAGRTFAVNLVEDDRDRIPQLLRGYLGRYDIAVIDLPGVRDEAPAPVFPPPKNLSPLSDEEFVSAVAETLGIRFERNHVLRIPSEIPKGVAAVNIPFVLSLPKKRVMVSFASIGERVSGWIRNQGMGLVSFHSQMPRRQFVAALLELAGATLVTPDVDFVLAGGAEGETATLTVPGILTRWDGKNLLFTGETPADEVLALMAGRGIGVVVY
jgi:hypothetical protein